MHMDEYQKVKNFTYYEYCDYLQKKYGIGKADYYTKSFYPNKKCSRTSEGLVAHHKKEDTMICLSNRMIAKKCPFEWQQKENIVYCDYLEHLLLHVLIRKEFPETILGLGGIIDYIIPELNDVYSGWVTKQPWRKNLHNKVIHDKSVYLEIIRQFYDIEKSNNDFNIDRICRSCNERFGHWDNKRNYPLYNKIKKKCKSLNRKRSEP